MTVFAVRDGVMAIDSRVSADGMVCGEIPKWRKVEAVHGGGFVAMAGDLGKVAPALDAFATYATAPPDGVIALHLTASGKVREYHEGWYEYDAPFYAGGAGEKVALAAMMAGADAERAVQIACEMQPADCGGKIHVLKLEDGE